MTQCNCEIFTFWKVSPALLDKNLPKHFVHGAEEKKAGKRENKVGEIKRPVVTGQGMYIAVVRACIAVVRESIAVVRACITVVRPRNV